MDASIPLDRLLLYGLGTLVAVVAFFARRTLSSLEAALQKLNDNVQAFERTVSSLENRIAVLDGEDARQERHKLRNQVNALLLWRARTDAAAPKDDDGTRD